MSTREALLDDARAAYDQSQWSAARAALRDADADQPIGADDLERLAWSCRWAGDPAGFLNALERAEVAFTDAGEIAGAARMALEQARHHTMMLDSAVALTCYVRATELLAEAPECAEHAQERWSLAFTLMAGWRRRRGAGGAPRRARDRPTGGQPGHGGDGGAGAGPRGRHRR